MNHCRDAPKQRLAGCARSHSAIMCKAEVGLLDEQTEQVCAVMTGWPEDSWKKRAAGKGLWSSHLRHAGRFNTVRLRAFLVCLSKDSSVAHTFQSRQASLCNHM